MEPLDFLKRRLDAALPVGHQRLLGVLTTGTLVLLLSPQQAQNLPYHSSLSFPPEIPVLGSGQANKIQDASDPAEPPAIVAEASPLVLEVGPGDNLTSLFLQAGLGPGEVYELTTSTPEGRILTELYPGDQLVFAIGPAQLLLSLELIKSPLQSLVFTRNEEEGYNFELRAREPTVQSIFKEAVISDSLFLAAQGSGIADSLAMELAGIFGGVIDFILDTREGDTFNLLYEEKFIDGKFIGTGNILAAQFSNKGQLYTAVRYENSAGEANYYNLEGESMRKAFLLNPVDFTRISSSFSVSRRHPILNTIRAHKGTDYAAPKGTPVVATADGRVSFVGRNGSFGKLVVLQHGERFETRYAHLNDYARGISKATRVRQGQVIGYVGSTGSATGPHLHYEFLMEGVHRNSRTIHDQLPRAESIAAEELPRFREQIASLVAQLPNKGEESLAFAQAAPLSRVE